MANEKVSPPPQKTREEVLNDLGNKVVRFFRDNPDLVYLYENWYKKVLKNIAKPASTEPPPSR